MLELITMAEETLNDLLMDMMGTGYYAPEPDPAAQDAHDHIDDVLAANADLVSLADRILLAKLCRDGDTPMSVAEMRHLSTRCLWMALVHQSTTLAVMLDHGDLFTRSGNMSFDTFFAELVIADNAPA